MYPVHAVPNERSSNPSSSFDQTGTASRSDVSPMMISCHDASQQRLCTRRRTRPPLLPLPLPLLLAGILLLALGTQPADAWNLRLFSRNRRPRRSTTHVDATPAGAGAGSPPSASSAPAGSAGIGNGPTDSPLFADLMGDAKLDLASTRKWFQREVQPRLPRFLTDAIPSALLSIWANLKALVLYKPPVGIVSVYLAFRMFARRRRAREMGLSDMQIREEKALGLGGGTSKWTSRRRKRPLDLDLTDRDYDTYGTVENVRGELASKALEGYDLSNGAANSATQMAPGGAQAPDGQSGVVRLGGMVRRNLSGVIVGAGQRIKRRLVPPPLETGGGPATKGGAAHDAAPNKGNKSSPQISPTVSEAVPAAMEALSVSCPPRGSRELYVLESANSVADLSKALAACQVVNNISPVPKPKDEEVIGLVDMSKALVEIRTLDAILRVARDRLISSSNRLRRVRSNWDFNVRVYSGGPIRRTLSKTFRVVLQWFGRGSLEDDRRYLSMAEAAYKKEISRLGAVQELLLSRPSEMRSEALLGALEGGGISKGAYGGGVVNPKGAKEILLQEKEVGGTWLNEAKRWSMEARSLIRDITTETFQTVASDKKCLPRLTVGEALDIVEDWSEGRRDADTESWHAVLVLVEGLATPRRVGEHRARIRAADVLKGIKKLDLGGVPSSMFLLWLAHVVHDSVAPHWKTMTGFGEKAVVAVWGVIDMRFWRPIRDITLDLLNRRPHLLDPYALTIEEASLDYMLRDLGVGDGTPEGRAAAVAAAARMYEDELKAGALKGLVRGRVVRLMLIQVQQLKAGLLKAMGSIDDLVDKNRLNVQLLASIPAFILVTYGSKFLFSFIVGLRMKRVTVLPIKNLQGEMTDCLRRIERCLLLSGREGDKLGNNDEDDLSSDNDEGGKTTKEMAEDLEIPDIASSKSKISQLSTDELGEFVLLCHSYLLLLDYATPPISYRTFDSVHRNMQELLLPHGQLSIGRQLKLLALIKAKNADLLKNI
mmetsp:Transcript_32274/g.95066  ORF Transcript_32274/g.95066 Transcript_32274/m.95066 type:complete len:999 (-) Transcript_32274:1283-4279(-)